MHMLIVQYKKNIEILTELFEDENLNLEVRISAIKALGNLNSIKVVKPLVNLIQNKNKDINRNAIKTLSKLVYIETIKKLQLLKKDKTPRVWLYGGNNKLLSSGVLIKDGQNLIYEFNNIKQGIYYIKFKFEISNVKKITVYSEKFGAKIKYSVSPFLKKINFEIKLIPMILQNASFRTLERFMIKAHILLRLAQEQLS